MNNKRTLRFRYFAAGIVTGLLVILSAVNADARTTESRTLKVAFPELEGISETDQFGRHSGLLVDYLDEIAKYTNWEYEYIPVENEDLIPNFLDGQYDLMGGTFYSPGYEEYFAYPEYNSGRSRAVLLCRKDDESLRGYDLTSLNGKTIGVYERAADKIYYLQEFLDSNGLDCELKYYSPGEMEGTGNFYRQLRDGEVDMLMGNDQETGGEFRTVTSFWAQPYYIVTTVGNNEVLEELNMALQYILETMPNFAEESYNDNFPDTRLADIQLNEKELNYISEKETVTVVVQKNWRPIYCPDSPPDQPEGILPEILAEISAFSGLKFSYVYADSYNESIKMVKRGEADILGGFLGDEEEALSYGLALTQSYIDLNNIILKNKKVSYPAAGLSCGILKGRTLPVSLEAERIFQYETVPEMIAAVNTGEVDYIYGMSAMLEQEMQKHRYLNVQQVSQAIGNTNVGLAVVRPVEPELLAILNKAIGNITTEEKYNMYNRNLISVGYTSMSLQDMLYANPAAFLLISGGVLILSAAGVVLIIKSRMKNSLMQSRLEAAEAKSMAKSEFLSQMSHEIRTPMNAIVGLTDLAIKAQGIPSVVEKKLEKIRSSSEYLLSLINDILDMSRIENKKIAVEQKNFSMSVVLEDIREMIEVQTEQKGIQFQVRCTINHEWLTGDAMRLRQILINLLSNAIKFTPAGGTVILEAEEISCDGLEAGYHFCVRDTGAGISKDDQERIFMAFEQVGSSAANSTGTGLGLPISRSFARVMGGDLQVKSEPGKGSEFYMTLYFPLGEEKEINKNTTAERQWDFSGMQILLAEDNDINAEIAQELLGMQGIAVRRAADGQEAVDLFNASETGEFQVILMDIRMPVMDGHQAAREIRNSRRQDADIPIIAMTANSFREDMEAARAAGMNGFVPKPVDPERLFSALQDCRSSISG